jgi:hypothetical protein
MLSSSPATEKERKERRKKRKRRKREIKKKLRERAQNE